MRAGFTPSKLVKLDRLSISCWSCPSWSHIVRAHREEKLILSAENEPLGKGYNSPSLFISPGDSNVLL